LNASVAKDHKQDHKILFAFHTNFSRLIYGLEITATETDKTDTFVTSQGTFSVGCIACYLSIEDLGFTVARLSPRKSNLAISHLRVWPFLTPR
jgi:hypothetical protein